MGLNDENWDEAIFSITGRLGKKPEMKSTASGMNVCTVSIAVWDGPKDKATGKKTTLWFDLTAFGDLALDLFKCDKGDKIKTHGRIMTRSWDDKTTGKKRYKTEFYMNDLFMIEKSMRSQQMGLAQQSAPQDDVPDFSDGVPF